MDSRDKAVPDLSGLVKSWINWRSEPPGLSRDFWMPDQSCRVCYDCDSQFALLNRRHHCRLCGRVFCSKCTSNSVPSPHGESTSGREDSDRIRVCNFCYKQWQQDSSSSSSFDLLPQDSLLSPSVSSKSSGTAAINNPSTDPEPDDAADKVNNGGFENRSDDDEYDYRISRSDSELKSFVEVEEPNQPSDIKRLSSSSLNTLFSNEAAASQPTEASSEPVDFESNGALWLPPEPEDEEDEKEDDFFEDDEEGEIGNGEWGRLPSSNSFGQGEFRNRERSAEEHKTVMKNVVDGHFRALVAQLLQVENVPLVDEDSNDSWLDIITFLSWEAATLLKPDTSQGGGMDPGGYVKVKCVASGRRSDSMVVRGVVCKKNVAHRRMGSKIEKPRILILGGALEYHRVSNHLSSLDTLLQQEMDYLKMAVTKIDAQQPDVLLVEKSVSRFAQDCLLAKDISLVLNIKRPLLERIARCSGAVITPSIDHLSSSKLGFCDLFYVKRYLEDLGSAGQGGKKLAKTLMYFEGCPKPFGFTILLRGANGDELKKVKHVVQYGVFAAYHLALETSFLADEGASLPDLPLNSPIAVALPDKSLTIERNHSTVSGFSVVGLNTTAVSSLYEPRRSNSVSLHALPSTFAANGFPHPRNPISREETDRSFDHPEASDDRSRAAEGNNGAEPVKEEFPPSPSDRQSILVSLSSRCVWKGSVCERAHLFRIKYYGSFDKPLGSFLRDHLFDQGYMCPSCGMPSEAHVHCYTHRQGTLTISVKKLPEVILPGEKDGKLWMWHRCLKCPRADSFPPATRRVVMSDAAWGLSFGKFLELSFSNHAAASRVASCGHSLHRDCLRFYGFGKMVACFRYASIDVFSVHVPPPKLDFNYDNQDWIEQEASKLVDRAELLFSEVLNALSQIADLVGSKVSENRRRVAELELLLQKHKADFEASFNGTRKREAKKGYHLPAVDVLDINRLHRQLLIQSYKWDRRLVCAAKLVSSCEGVNGLPADGGEMAVTDCSDVNGHVDHPAADILDDDCTLANLSDTLDAAWTGTNPIADLEAPEDSLGDSVPSYVSSIGVMEREYGGQLLLPMGVNDTVVPVFDDEPTSAIAYVLTLAEYQRQLIDEGDGAPDAPLISPVNSFDDGSLTEEGGVPTLTSTRSSASLDPLSYNKALHARVSFEDDGKVKYSVACYYAKRFDALRKICCSSELEYVRSLSRCKKWGAQGGKSNVFFAKTLDERFIVKQVTKTELESFIKFGPEYFKYLSESIGSRSPTCLAKILGIYHVAAKHPKSGKESKMDLLVMENLLFSRKVSRVYDLKGSARSRYNADSSGSNKVLLDQNLIEAMPTAPIFVGNKAKRLLERAVWNDTSFLACVDVMDYSLLVGVDEESHELVVGIIDFMRQYTWDKHLETWVKASGILGGPKNMSPTVVSPKQYKKRFRKAMTTYFLMVPDQWSPPVIVPSHSDDANSFIES